MNLYKFEYDIISAESKEDAIAISEAASGEKCQDDLDSIKLLSGDITLTFDYGNELPLPPTAMISKPKKSFYFTATDTAENWANFWPNQVIASELE